MSSDLPDTLPGSSIRMARMLVQTMSCDRAVQARLREDYAGLRFGLRTIRQLRIEAACSRLPLPDMDPPKAHEGYYPNEVFDRAARQSSAFLDRLRAAYPERFAA